MFQESSHKELSAYDNLVIHVFESTPLIKPTLVIDVQIKAQFNEYVCAYHIACVVRIYTILVL